jgi:mevalonate kinase
MKIKVSAPGKLMLLGEHAVVYGYPCIVTAVDKRLYVEAEISTYTEDEIITPQVKESRFVLESIALFKEKFGVQQNVRIKTNGDFSHTVGLGSSSAVTVATFRALSELFKIPLSNRKIFDLSYGVTLKIQGVGSGFDIAAATFGNALYFIKGGKTIELLNIKPLPLVVGYSGIKADTPFYIRKVAEAFRSRKDEMNSIFASIQTLVEKAKKHITLNQLQKLGFCMNENQAFLHKLGVSIPKLDKMIQAASDAGAWGAKLSGAGGGDCMVALVSNDKRKAVENAIINAGGEIITVENNAEGVRIEK